MRTLPTVNGHRGSLLCPLRPRRHRPIRTRRPASPNCSRRNTRRAPPRCARQTARRSRGGGFIMRKRSDCRPSCLSRVRQVLVQFRATRTGASVSEEESRVPLLEKTRILRDHLGTSIECRGTAFRVAARRRSRPSRSKTGHFTKLVLEVTRRFISHLYRPVSLPLDHSGLAVTHPPQSPTKPRLATCLRLI